MKFGKSLHRKWFVARTATMNPPSTSAARDNRAVVVPRASAAMSAGTTANMLEYLMAAAIPASVPAKAPHARLSDWHRTSDAHTAAVMKRTWPGSLRTTVVV